MLYAISLQRILRLHILYSSTLFDDNIYIQQYVEVELTSLETKERRSIFYPYQLKIAFASLCTDHACVDETTLSWRPLLPEGRLNVPRRAKRDSKQLSPSDSSHTTATSSSGNRFKIPSPRGTSSIAGSYHTGHSSWHVAI
jgi:hypothetical protein